MILSQVKGWSLHCLLLARAEALIYYKMLTVYLSIESVFDSIVWKRAISNFLMLIEIVWREKKLVVKKLTLDNLAANF